MKTHPEYPHHSPNQYLVHLINQNLLKPLHISDERIRPLLNVIYHWGGSAIANIKISGSSAKGTALKGKADLDIFISLRESTYGTLKEIYDSLFNAINGNRFKLKLFPKKQNVSIRVFYKGFKIDIVPGKKQPGLRNWHNIYVRRDPKDRTMTNIDEHINIIKESGRLDEIITLKIWRNNHNLDFPSIYLELLTIEALRGRHSGKSYLARNFLEVLSFIGDAVVNRAVYDPINSNNIISHTLTKTEKRKIQSKALSCLKKNYLSEVIW